MSQFDIEQILQYSYSQQNSTFSFSYLEEGRFFVTHKFLTQDVKNHFYFYFPKNKFLTLSKYGACALEISSLKFTSIWEMPSPLS